MKVAVFGATGRTGRLVVEKALAAGDRVTAFARDPSKLGVSDERLRVVEGDVYDPARVEEAVAGQDAVVSAVGPVGTSPDDVQTEATKNIVAAMEKHGVRRLVSVTGGMVRDPRDVRSPVTALVRAVVRPRMGTALTDAENHAEVLRRSGLDWVMLHAPLLTDKPPKGRYRVGYMALRPRKFARADLADAMLREVADDRYVRGAPMVRY